MKPASGTDGINKIDFDYHTKLISTIKMITFDEIEMFNSFTKYFVEIEKINDKQDINSKIPSGVNTTQITKHLYFDSISPEYLEYTLTSLANYGLIYSAFGRYDGTIFGPITYFGKKFTKYLKSN